VFYTQNSAVRNVIKLREWLKDEFYRLGNETWKGVFIIQGNLLEIRQNLEKKLTQIIKNFSEVGNETFLLVIEGPVLDCWNCLRMTTRCFKGDYCQDEDPKTAENREISLYLIFIAEAVILASAVLLQIPCLHLTSEENEGNTKNFEDIFGEETRRTSGDDIQR
ncbi:mCG13299, partial [Mus musculus]